MERSEFPRRAGRSFVRVLIGLVASALLGAGSANATSQSVAYDSDTASSRVTVKGTSTMHHWTAEGHIIQGELVFRDGDRSRLWTSKSPTSGALSPVPMVHVEIPVESLRSDNSKLNRKMHEALKAQTHPTIRYRLEQAQISRDQVTQSSESDERVTFDTAGVLTVAGVDRSVDIPMQVKRLHNQRLEVQGETPLRMTDFGIDPPGAMAGMLRAGDAVHVHWIWTLAPRQADEETSKTQAPR